MGEIHKMTKSKFRLEDVEEGKSLEGARVLDSLSFSERSSNSCGPYCTGNSSCNCKKDCEDHCYCVDQCPCNTQCSHDDTCPYENRCSDANECSCTGVMAG